MTGITFYPSGGVGFAITFPTFELAPGQLHNFASRRLEECVFTHRSAAPTTATYESFSHAANYSGGRAARWRNDNEHLEFIGDMVLKGLTGMLIEELHPDADEGYMSALTTVVLSNSFYAHMSRAHGLDRRLRLQGVNHENVLESERVLGGLFEAYIAGVYKEYGNAGFAALYAWFAWWMRPYFVEISTQLRRSDQPEFSTPSLSPVSRLHEYVDAHRLPQPEYRFVQVEGCGYTGAPEWACVVQLGETEVRGKTMSKKKLAKDEGCKAALEYLMNT